MTPTNEQIKAAARLAPDYVEIFDDIGVTVSDDYIAAGARAWEPWSATEAGRSDALVLLAAVMLRFHVMDDHTFHRLAPYQGAVNEALRSGNVQQIQQATFDAAVAIGEYMGESDDR